MQSKTLAAVFQIIFAVLGIPPGTAKQLFDDPILKKQINNVRKSLDNIKSVANKMQQLADDTRFRH